MNKSNYRQQGLTLIELLVGLAVGVIVSIFISNIYITNVVATKDSINASRLENDLRASMALMVNEIRRAGYWGGAVTGTGTSADPVALVDPTVTPNPFMDRDTTATEGATDIQIGKKSGEADYSCITFTYDRDLDGSLDDNEKYAFRLNSGVLEFRQGGTTGVAHTCDGTASDWSELTDGDVMNIDTLTFSYVNSTGSCVTYQAGYVTTVTATAATAPCETPDITKTPGSGVVDKLIEARAIKLNVSAKLVNDSAVKESMEQVIRIRNNRIAEYTWP